MFTYQAFSNVLHTPGKENKHEKNQKHEVANKRHMVIIEILPEVMIGPYSSRGVSLKASCSLPCYLAWVLFSLHVEWKEHTDKIFRSTRHSVSGEAYACSKPIAPEI